MLVRRTKAWSLVVSNLTRSQVIDCRPSRDADAEASSEMSMSHCRGASLRRSALKSVGSGVCKAESMSSSSGYLAGLGSPVGFPRHAVGGPVPHALDVNNSESVTERFLFEVAEAWVADLVKGTCHEDAKEQFVVNCDN